MHSRVNTYIDFDGTLIRENSSQVLMDYLLDRPTTRGQRALALILHSPLNWLITKLLGLATRATGEKDAKLRLILMFFRNELSHSADKIFNDVARELHLNPQLSTEYRRPFIILSVGLQPLIEHFLALNPQLNCVGIYGSKIDFDGHTSKPVLKSMSHKLDHLSQAKRPRYFTDFRTEAQLFQSALSGTHHITTMPDPGHNTLYLLEDKS